MLHLIRPPDRSIADRAAELGERIAAAYTQVAAARQILAALPPLPDLPVHLQIAEAELVRATVALSQVDLEDFGGAGIPRPPAKPVTPIDGEHAGYEYGS